MKQMEQQMEILILLIIIIDVFCNKSLKNWIFKTINLISKSKYFIAPNFLLLQLQSPNFIARKILPQPQNIPDFTWCQPPSHTSCIRTPIVQQFTGSFQIQQSTYLQQSCKLVPDTSRTSRIQITYNCS